MRKPSAKAAPGAPARVRAAAKVRRSEGARPVAAVDLGMMAQSVAFQLRHASWAVHNAFGAHFSPSDAVPRQYSVLHLIGANPGVSVKALAEAIGVDQSTLVPTLNICESRGWIRRERGMPDRRLVALELTAGGRETLEQMQEMLQAHEALVTSTLSEAERVELLSLLRKVRAAAMSKD